MRTRSILIAVCAFGGLARAQSFDVRVGADPQTQGGAGRGTGQGTGQGRVRTDLGIVIPVEPREHDRLQWFGRQDHHVVPGTVTIDKAPYVCDAHDRRFRDKDAFVAHLRADHGLRPDEIPDRLVVLKGVVHFSGSE